MLNKGKSPYSMARKYVCSLHFVCKKERWAASSRPHGAQGAGGVLFQSFPWVQGMGREGKNKNLGVNPALGCVCHLEKKQGNVRNDEIGTRTKGALEDVLSSYGGSTQHWAEG